MITPESAERILDRSVDMIAVLDHTGRYLYVSPAVERLLGYRAAELIGRHCAELIHPDDVENLSRDHFGGLGIDVTREVEYRVRRADGTYTWFETTSQTLVDDGERPTRIHSVSRDISARKVAEARFELALLHAPIGIALVDLDGAFLHTNPAFCDLMGRSAEELSQVGFQVVTHPDDLDRDLELVGECIAGRRDGYQMDKRYRRPDGSEMWGHLAVVLLRDPNGSPMYFISQVQDITERKRHEARLLHDARHDALTGLVNRASGLASITEAIARADRSGRGFALLFCDLDGFKAINDDLGHAAGDRLLVVVADRLGSAVRPGDVVVRWGGDEFVVICDGLEDESGAAGVTARLQEAVDAPVWHGTGPLTVSVTTGVSHYVPGSGEAAAELVDRADQAMYALKPLRS